MESNSILSKKNLKNSDFAGLNSTVATNRKKNIYATILYLYKLNT